MSEQTNQHPLVPKQRRFWMGATIAGAIAVLSLSACGHHRNAAEPSERITHMVDRVFSKVDASAEQKQQITGIAQAAYQTLNPLRGEMRAARTQAVQLLTEPQIDRAALEQLRTGQLSNADKASSTISKAMADIAAVLTPEQRIKVREHLASREGHWRKRWGRHGS